MRSQEENKTQGCQAGDHTGDTDQQQWAPAGPVEQSHRKNRQEYVDQSHAASGQDGLRRRTETGKLKNGRGVVNHRVDSSDLLEYCKADAIWPVKSWASDRPALIMIVDTADNIRRLIPVVEEMKNTGLLATSEVQMLRVEKRLTN